jgi:hypothetical protein
MFCRRVSPASYQHRREDRCIKGVGAGWPIFDRQNVRLVADVSANTGAGERAPELCRQQHCYNATRAGQCNSTLDEDRGEINLHAERGSWRRQGKRAQVNTLPAHMEFTTVSLAIGIGDLVRAHPGWVPDHGIESPIGIRVGEVHREGERKCSPRFEGAKPNAQGAGPHSQIRAPFALGGSGVCRIPEQVSAAGEAYGVEAQPDEVGELSLYGIDGTGALGAFDRSEGDGFVCPGCPCVAVSEASHENTLSTSCDEIPDHRHAECASGKGVADPHISIEVGERENPNRVGFFSLDDDGEPETKLAQPNSCWIDIHSEDRPRQDGTPPHTRGARISGAAG